VIRHFMSRQFAAFLLTGGIAAAVNLGSRVLYSQWLAFSPAVLLAYLNGMVTAFILARLFVFRDSTQAVPRAAAIFVLVNLVAVLQTWAISVAMLRYAVPALGITRFGPEIAHAAGVAVPVFTSYLGHKHWSFR
jgi:putative flippase GtrA